MGPPACGFLRATEPGLKGSRVQQPSLIGELKATAGASSPPALASLPRGLSLMQGSPRARTCPRSAVLGRPHAAWPTARSSGMWLCVWVPPGSLSRESQVREEEAWPGEGSRPERAGAPVYVCPGAGPCARRALPCAWGTHQVCGAYVCPRSLGLPSHSREQVPPPHLPVPAGPYPTPPPPGPYWAVPHAPTPWSWPRLRGLPVALPSVPHICVVDAVSVCLLIQEIEHVLDGQGERAAPVHSAEQGLKQVIHELLQGALGEGRWERVRWGRGAGSRRTGRMVPCLE